MKLEDLGYNDKLEKSRVDHNLKDFGVGRVVSEHKERCVVKTENGESHSVFRVELPEKRTIDNNVLALWQVLKFQQKPISRLLPGLGCGERVAELILC